jgi:hypothetical protein
MRPIAIVSALALVGVAVYAWTPTEAPAEPPDHVAITPTFPAIALGQLASGGEVTFHGAVRTSNDGTVLDAVSRTDLVGADHEAVTRPGGLYDLAGSGLRVTMHNPATHEVRLVADGADAPACRARGISSPCLVPRVTELAHARLLTNEEFLASLSGRVDATIPHAPFVAPPPPSHALSYGAGGAALAILVAAFAWTARRRKSSPMGQVHAAAREARAATKKDKTLASVHARIDALVARALALEASREACEARLAKIDSKALGEKRTRLASSASPGAADALEWAENEQKEAERLAADLAASVAGIERVTSALRVIALHAREHRGVQVRVADDPVDAVGSELEMRDEAAAETDQLTR